MKPTVKRTLCEETLASAETPLSVGSMPHRNMQRERLIWRTLPKSGQTANASFGWAALRVSAIGR